jgi:hypothetical protein
MPIPDFHTRMSQSSTGGPLLGALRRLRQLDSVAQLRCAFALGDADDQGAGGSSGWAVWDHQPVPAANP